MEKVLIISKPRFGSTALSKVLGELKQAHVFDEPNLKQIPILKKLCSKKSCIVKIIVGDNKNEKNYRELILPYPFDVIILLHRDENDAKTSMSYAMQEPDTFAWHKPYRQDKTKEYLYQKVNMDTIDKFYKDGGNFYDSIRNEYKDKVIEIRYDELYNEDIDRREKELNKIHNMDKTHWLLRKNALDRLDPKNKYTNQPLLPPKGIL